MEWTIRGHNEIAQTAADYGLDAVAIEKILGSPNKLPGPAPVPLAGCPKGAESFWAREYVVSEIFMERFRSPEWTLPDPFGENPNGLEPLDVAFVQPASLRGTYVVCELERFGSLEHTVITATTALYSRVSVVLFPALRLAVHFLAETAARSLAEVIDNGYPTGGALEFRSVPKRPSIAYLDLVTNHGHQLLNSLSGLQRLVDSGLSANIDELYVRGVEFYGRVEQIFPEFEGKVRRFETSAAFSDALGKSGRRAFRVGSCFTQSRLRDRIFGIAPSLSTPLLAKGSTAPLVAVSLRDGSRECVNLVETIAAIMRKLRSHNKNSRVILDGWVVPETQGPAYAQAQTVVSARPELLREMATAEAIIKRLPKGSVVENLIGKTMLESISVIRYATAYFAHVGTLQHKLGNFSGAPGMVHGPIVQLQRREAGHYLTENGIAPVFLDPADVVDSSQPDSSRGGLAQGYSIRDPEEIARRFVRLALRQD